MHAGLVLDALEQTLWSRSGIKGVVHHSDRGSQYLSIRCSGRLAQREQSRRPAAWVIHTTETVIGLYKTAVIHRRAPWQHLQAVDYATLEWSRLFNHRRPLEPIGNVPPTELEASYYHSTNQLAMAA